jgi:rubrerythrin
MNDFTMNAIASAIKTEKESHDFYLLAANRVKDPDAKKLLKNLAEEEFEHLTGFLSLYPGDAPKTSSFTIDDLNVYGNGGKWKILSMDRRVDNRQEVLNIAIKEEQSCIDLYSVYVETIKAPEVRRIFEQALEQTRQHLETIEAEYARCMAMVDDSEMNTYVRE